jgi:hypothetical protein
MKAADGIIGLVSRLTTVEGSFRKGRPRPPRERTRAARPTICAGLGSAAKAPRGPAAAQFHHDDLTLCREQFTWKHLLDETI